MGKLWSILEVGEFPLKDYGDSHGDTSKYQYGTLEQ